MNLTPALRIGAATALGAAAFLAYSYKNRENGKTSEPLRLQHAGFDEGEAGRHDPNAVRNAGRASMRSTPPLWDRVDDTNDESFPASDPPANY